VLGISRCGEIARLSRAQCQSTLRNDFVLASTALGATRLHIFHRHLLPHLSSILTVSASVAFAAAIIAESTLSFLGLAAAGRAELGHDAEQRPGQRARRGVVGGGVSRSCDRGRGRLHQRDCRHDIQVYSKERAMRRFTHIHFKVLGAALVLLVACGPTAPASPAPNTAGAAPPAPASTAANQVVLAVGKDDGAFNILLFPRSICACNSLIFSTLMVLNDAGDGVQGDLVDHWDTQPDGLGYN